MKKKFVIPLSAMCGLFLKAVDVWAEDEGIRDVKGPNHYPVETIWIVLTIIVCVLILTSIAVLSYKKYKKLMSKKREKALTPVELAKKQLKELRGKDYFASKKLYLYYAELSDILRLYLENQFLIRAPEMTTEEFLVSIKDNDKLSDTHKAILRNFLEYSDIVKFAKHTPTQSEVDDGYELAIKFIQQTEKIEE